MSSERGVRFELAVTFLSAYAGGVPAGSMSGFSIESDDDVAKRSMTGRAACGVEARPT